jgi:16S rRNA (uracil1498-N3)-methyltransferase
MQFSYHENSGDFILNITNDLYKYLFKIRRHNKQKNIFFRNLKDNNIYEYEVLNINKKNAQLKLINSKELITKQNKNLHLAWCVTDTKTIEKTLPFLNELGVYKISFIYCNYSQKHFKINFDKLKKILINSSMQCGRNDIVKLENYNNLDTFLEKYPDSYIFNFSSNNINNYLNNIQTIVVGCEGGFSKNEILKFNQNKTVGINSNLILRSETAIITIASKILV